MSPEMLLRQFEVMADAPNGVQKLRELILHLAVRGKLVPQDPSDEPARMLLERIAAEKQRLFNQGTIGKPKMLPPVGKNEVHCDLPHGWAWVRLSEIGEFCGGATPSKNRSSYWDGDVPWVSPKDMKADHITRSEDTITSQAVAETRLRLVPSKSILIVTRSGILRRTLPVGINQMPCTVNQDLKVLVPYVSALDEYIRILLKGHEALILRNLVKGGTTVQSVVFNQFEKYPFPLPPLAEQERIVAKVDELMTLCDRLEARQQRRAQARVRLNRSTLHHLTAATDDAELAAHWERLQENFHLLYDRPQTIAELRQAVLHLAVRGKLVPQDPSDEPASVLLERIAAGKQWLLDERRISKPKPLPLVSESEVPFAVPEGWKWTRFGDATINRDAERIPVASAIRAQRQGPYPYYGASGIIDHIDDFLFDKTLLLIGEDGANLLLRSTPIAYFAEGKYWVNNHAHVIDGISLHLLQYVAIFINAISLAPYVTGTAQPKLNQAKLNSIPVALPPLPEQRRIVAKVDELMALCDRLEARLTAAREKSARLAASVVHHLAAA